MTTPINWHSRILSDLASGAISHHRMFETLREMKAASVSKEAAYALLEEIRQSESHQLSEDQDDLLLGLMDIVSGFCSPHNRIW